jgi:hypothetical protein
MEIVVREPTPNPVLILEQIVNPEAESTPEQIMDLAPESILVDMADESFEGALGYGTKRESDADNFPVFGSSWYDWHHGGVTVDQWRSTPVEWFDLPPVENPVVPRETFRAYNPEIHDIIQAHRPGSDPKEEAYDEVYQLLATCLHRKDRSLEKAEQAVQLVEQHSLSKFKLHLVRGLVHFPHLLKRFLAVLNQEKAGLDDDDLGAMICRCIEHQPGDTILKISLKHLLDFKGPRTLEIKLLPRKYRIDSEFYEMAQWENVHDSYYEATYQCEPFVYAHMDVVKKEQLHKYTGFRDAYHCLLYGGSEHLQALIVRWDLWGDDCTTDAAREFLEMVPETSLMAVKARVNKRSLSLH